MATLKSEIRTLEYPSQQIASPSGDGRTEFGQEGGAGAQPPSVSPSGAGRSPSGQANVCGGDSRRIRDIPTELRPREELKRRGAAAMDLEKLLADMLYGSQVSHNQNERIICYCSNSIHDKTI